MDRNDERDIAYVIVAGAALALTVRVWTTTIKPWLASSFDLGQGDALLTVGGLAVSTTDIVGVGSILLPLLICGYLLRRKVKTVKKNRKLRAQQRTRDGERSRATDA